MEQQDKVEEMREGGIFKVEGEKIVDGIRVEEKVE